MRYHFIDSLQTAIVRISPSQLENMMSYKAIVALFLRKILQKFHAIAYKKYTQAQKNKIYISISITFNLLFPQ